MRTAVVTADNASGHSIRVMFSVHFVRVKHFKLRVLDKKNSSKNLKKNLAKLVTAKSNSLSSGKRVSPFTTRLLSTFAPLKDGMLPLISMHLLKGPVKTMSR